jgi:hypothetical protein
MGQKEYVANEKLHNSQQITTLFFLCGPWFHFLLLWLEMSFAFSHLSRLDLKSMGFFKQFMTLSCVCVPSKK